MAILFEVPSWNTLQICAQLTATTCSCYCQSVLFPSQLYVLIPPKSDTISVCIWTQRPTDTYSMPFISIVGVYNWLFTIDPHDSWNVTRPLPYPSSLAPWTLLPPFYEQASSNYPLWIRIRQEYYTSFQMCHWCSLKIPITRSCHCLKASTVTIIMLQSSFIQELKISSWNNIILAHYWCEKPTICMENTVLSDNTYVL